MESKFAFSWTGLNYKYQLAEEEEQDAGRGDKRPVCRWDLSLGTPAWKLQRERLWTSRSMCCREREREWSCAGAGASIASSPFACPHRIQSCWSTMCPIEQGCNMAYRWGPWHFHYHESLGLVSGHLLILLPQRHCTQTSLFVPLLKPVRPGATLTLCGATAVLLFLNTPLLHIAS